MELQKISSLIIAKQSHLDEKCKQLDDAANNKATKEAEYDKAIAIAMMKLRNHQPLQIGQETIIDPPATLIEKLAKGACYQEKIDTGLADSNYKSLITKINAIEAQLNGYQTLYRHQEEVETSII